MFDRIASRLKGRIAPVVAEPESPANRAETTIRRQVGDILAYRSLAPKDKIARLRMMQADQERLGAPRPILGIIEDALRGLERGITAQAAE